MKKLWFTASTLLVAVFMFSACGAQPNAPLPSQTPVEYSETPIKTEETSLPTTKTQANWINSNVVGNVTVNTPSEKKDDFYLAVNHDWLMNTKLSAGKSRRNAFAEREEEVQKEIEEMLKDTTTDSHEIKLAQQFYNEYLDIEKRNELGIQPLLVELEEILSVSSLEELTNYIVNEGNNTMAIPSVLPDAKDSSKYSVAVMPGKFTLSDADEYKKMTPRGELVKKALEEYSLKAFMRIGYSEEEAKAAWNASFEFETKLAQQTMGVKETHNPDYQEKTYNVMTIDEIQKASPAFPLVESLNKAGYKKSNIITIADTAWLSKLNELYTEENLEGIKSNIILKIIRAYGTYLDEEFQVISDEFTNATMGSVGSLPIEQKAYMKVKAVLEEVIGKPYAEKYFSQKTKTDVEKLIAETLNVYRKRIENNDWLGTETKKKAIEKLNAIIVNVGYPETFKDFSDLTFKSIEDGGNLIEYIEAVNDHKKAQELEKINESVDRNNSQSLSVTHMVNAFYDPSVNSINIPAGILGGITYDENSSVASKMGCMGIIIGHEITHAFDSNGGQYDKDGNLSNWWTKEDSAAFKEHTDKVAEYFGAIEVLPGMNANGELFVSEATADLGGVSSMLEIAKDIPDFNYDDFFTAYAKLWAQVATKENIESLLNSDPHPPSYLRTNAIIQHFPEFYTTYDVKEGDGMYVAPEEHLSVW